MKVDIFKMIKVRHEIRSNNNRSRESSGSPCMLDYMLEISEQHPEFTEQDIVDEACTMMLAVSFS